MNSLCIKPDKLYDSHYDDISCNVEFKKMIPLQQDDKGIITFQYLEDWTDKFPPVLCFNIVELILNYISCFNLLLKQTEEDKCTLCNTDNNDNNNDVICNRCKSYFCLKCWKNLCNCDDRHCIYCENKDNEYIWYVRYSDCPSCCAGLPFNETES